MALETGTYISDLNASNPAAGDGLQQGDDHLRLIKQLIKATFPSITGAVSVTHTAINSAVAAVSGTVELLMKAGTAAAPGLTPIGDTNTGLYAPAADEFAISTAGTKRVHVKSDGTVEITGALVPDTVIKAADGAVGAPSYTFGTDLDNGWYLAGANNPALSAGGTKVLEGATTGVTVTGLLTQSSTSHFVPANGTTAQRPGSPAAGNARYNSTLSAFEFYDGAAWRSVRSPTMQYLTSGTSATYTTPAGATRLRVKMRGGGAGGQAVVNSVNTSAAAAGGNTSFNSIVANGGGAPAANPAAADATAPGAGGTGGTGSASLRIAGQKGGWGWSANNATRGPSGAGGGAGGGAAMMQTSASSNAGNPGITNTGGGGSGGAYTSSSRASGSGGGEGEYAEFDITNPSATYTYTVGAGGAGGDADSIDGGAGGSGLITVEEYYT